MKHYSLIVQIAKNAFSDCAKDLGVKICDVF